MLMKLTVCILLTAILPCLCESSHSIHRNDTIGQLSIPAEYVNVQIGAYDDLYSDKFYLLRNYTVDEKCERGLDLGVGFYLSAPYVNVKNDSNNWLLSGIFPHVMTEFMQQCCPRSKVGYGKVIHSMLEVYRQFNGAHMPMDISFPVHSHHGEMPTEFRGLPFISIVTAPRIVLLIPDLLYEQRNTRTTVLMKTIINTWPMLVFIIVSAMLSGLVVWFLDRKINSAEFPLRFFSGAWEGIWWAFVTMTTVGYGDRSPKSIYGRAFCIMWILLGIMLISLFTGLMSTALNVSATPVFNVAGAKIGAIGGSMEYQFGVTRNAEMKSYDDHHEMLADLVQLKNIDAAMIDNFHLTTCQDILQKDKLRSDREYAHPITYGMVLANNSTVTEKCFRKYISMHLNKMFEMIADKLVPVKNPTDQVRVEVLAAERFFYEDHMFKIIVCTEVLLLVIALAFGIVWEVRVMNKNSAAYRFLGRFRRGSSFGEIRRKSDDKCIEKTNFGKTVDLQALLKEYDEYHKIWMNRVRNINKRSQKIKKEYIREASYIY